MLGGLSVIDRRIHFGDEVTERRWLRYHDALAQLSYADERALLAGTSEEGTDAERSP